jgi:hypothetical protein
MNIDPDTNSDTDMNIDPDTNTDTRIKSTGQKTIGEQHTIIGR